MMRRLFLVIARFVLVATRRWCGLRDFVMWPLATRVLGAGFHETVHVQGIALRVGLEDYLTRLALFFGNRSDYIWEPQTTRLAQALSRDARSAVVAGGHVGYTALMVRKSMQRPGSVLYTFEPIASLYKIAQENYGMNRSLGKIVHEPFCLSRAAGTATMEARASQSAVVMREAGDRRDLTTVPTVRLDEYAAQKDTGPIDFALFDVEGHEDAVLEGMQGLLARGQPTHMILEYSMKIQRDDAKMASYLNMLRPFGYALYIIHDDYEHRDMRVRHDEPITLTRFDDVRVKQFTSSSYFNVLATKISTEELTKLCAGLRVS